MSEDSRLAATRSPNALSDDQTLAEGTVARSGVARSSDSPALPTTSAVASNLNSIKWPTDGSTHPPGLSPTPDFTSSPGQSTLSLDPTKGNLPVAGATAPNGWASSRLGNPPPVGSVQTRDILSDGRIRNPVPSKLQHKPNGMEGNFAVMHMDVKKSAIDARDMAAKRTSEMTQAAAIKATKQGYQPLKRSKLAWTPFTPEQTAGQTPWYTLAGQPNESLHVHHPPQVPDSETVKSEQARLLTFLRSLQPIVVVDQLCTALAYFGGIPGAPAPSNNAFPESDHRNGPGSLFIGWVSEIFPPADLNKTPFAALQPGTSSLDPASTQPNTSTPHIGELSGLDASVPPGSSEQIPTNGTDPPPKRRRGRPKGSKSSKARKDKGLKKGARLIASNAQADGTLEAMPSQPASSSQLPDQSQPTIFTTSSIVSSGIIGPDSGSLSTPGKKRGRPKGSKNRPKSLGAESLEPNSPASPTPNPTPNNSAPSLNKLAATGWNPVDPATSRSPQSRAPLTTRLDPNMPRSAFGAEGTLSQHAQNWADPPTQDYPQTIRHTDSVAEHSPSTKRKSAIEAAEDHSSVPATQTAKGYGAHSISPMRQENHHISQENQGSRNKRRRVSKESNQPTPSGDMTTSLPGIEAPTSPAISQNIQDNAAAVRTNRSFDSQSPKNGTANMRSNSIQMMHQQPHQQPQQRGPYLHHQRQQQQQQFQKLQQPQQQRSPAQHMARPSPNADSVQQGLQGRAQNQLPGPFPPQSQSQQQTHNRSSQNLYGQRQQQQQQQPQQPQQPRQQPPQQPEHHQGQGRFAQGGNQYGPHATSSSQPYTQNPTSGPGPQAATSSPSTASLAPTSSAYSNFSDDPSYINMQYAMNASRAVQSTAGVYDSQPTQTQLAAALAQPDMRDRLYNAFGRR